MAGIGFELRKIFGKKTLFSNTWGVIYATMTTVGPSIMFLLLLFSIRIVMNRYHATELEMNFFTASFTYVFMLAIILSAFLNTVVSRYVSDQIFEKKEDDICASMFGVLTIGSAGAGILAAVLCAFLYAKDQPSIVFLLGYYLLALLATNCYNLITYVSALKEYKEVTSSYFLGILVTILMFLLLHNGVGVHLIMAVYWALDAGFFVINLILVYWCVKAFGKPSKKYFEFMHYFKKYPKLMISGLCYILGFYISNIVYWFASDMKMIVSIFHVAPNYDMAIFLATLINMSAMIIFEVKTETTFYEKYVSYLSVLNQGTYELIEKERQSMQNTINLQLFFVYEVQLIITIILICLANIVYPYFGINAQILNMFILLSMGLYCTFCMYFTIVFLYYFEDHTAACLAPVVFFVIVLIGSLICACLGSPYYPIPVLAGSLAGWIVSFVSLRRRIKNLNAYLLCQ